MQSSSVIIGSPEDALNRLKQGNLKYLESAQNPSHFSETIRKDTAENGQKPYAVILTCSDSRVPPEHIFSAGIGELFVIRTAGNVVSEFELGSIEYGTAHLNAKVIVVMGHSGCGAVAAAMAGHAEGHISDIVAEIKKVASGLETAAEAENANVAYIAGKIYEKSDIIRELVKSGKVRIVQAKYDIRTGQVEFFEDK